MSRFVPPSIDKLPIMMDPRGPGIRFAITIFLLTLKISTVVEITITAISAVKISDQSF